MVKLGEGSCGDKHGGKDDSKTNKKRSGYNLRSKDPKTEGSMGPPTYNLRNKVQKTEPKNASKKKPPKKNVPKDSSVATQRRVIPETEPKTTQPKTSTFPIIDTGIKKPSTTSMAANNISQPSSSQLEPFFHDPVYHIRWEGYELGSGQCGEICVICNKDLSSTMESDDDDDDGESEYNEDSLYGDDDDDVEYGYFDERGPPLLPIVDILACGHAYHTECMKNGAHDEQSGDPICVLCSRMA